MLTATKKHPNDPYLLSFMQYIMEQTRGAGRGRSLDPTLSGMLGGADESQESASGLVLPGHSEPQESKSKLWLPGS